MMIEFRAERNWGLGQYATAECDVGRREVSLPIYDNKLSVKIWQALEKAQSDSVRNKTSFGQELTKWLGSCIEARELLDREAKRQQEQQEIDILVASRL